MRRSTISKIVSWSRLVVEVPNREEIITLPKMKESDLVESMDYGLNRTRFYDDLSNRVTTPFSGHLHEDP